MVSLREVDSRADLRPWARAIGEIYKPDSRRQLWDIECACDEFCHSANLCVHAVVMAIALDFVETDALTDGAEPRRGPGRPRKDKGWHDTSSGAPKQRDAAAFLADIRNGSPMRHHRHYVMVAHKDEGYLLGYVRNPTMDTPPKYRIMLIDNAEELVLWDDAQLAAGLALALKWGKSGVYTVAVIPPDAAPNPNPPP
jgi:hypothetical protein